MDVLDRVRFSQRQPRHCLRVRVIMADLLAAHSGIEVVTAQKVLETSDLKTRVEIVIEAVAKAREMMKLNNEIESSVKTEMSKTQREFLAATMRAIEKELGEKGEDEDSDLDDLAKKLEGKLPHMPEDARISAEREIKRLKRIQPSSMEHSMLLNWLEWVVDLPWGETTQDMLDVQESMAQLDADHHGLQGKDRIVEFLASSTAR